MSSFDDTAGGIGESVLFQDLKGGFDSYLDKLTKQFRDLGAQHILITGMPLPGKDLSNLILFQRWAETDDKAGLLGYVKGDDPLLRRIAALNQPRLWRLGDPEASWLRNSSFIQLLESSRHSSESYRSIIGIHIHSFDQLQIVICLAGEAFNLNNAELRSMACSIRLALMDLNEIEPVMQFRPGQLSSRERHILSLTAQGKTANDIADELRISQRTVHAHLQNASDKMCAANKTQTVVEAMRYGQIELV